MSGSQSPTCNNRNIEKVLEDSQYTGEINFTGRKLKCFPKSAPKFDLLDTSKAELSHNQFADVPEEVCTFSSLEHLNLSHNQIRILPFSLTNLHELVEINISKNLLTAFPAFICQLHHLQVIGLSGNKIISIPEEIGQLMKLTSLDMSCNELTHLPNQLGELYSLKILNLRRNQLIELPICLTRLRLCILDISCNRIAHIPCDFRKVTSLDEILVEGNPLVSPPAHLCLRGLVHIMKFLHKEATKHEHHRMGLISTGSIQRRLKRSSSFSASSDGRLGGLDRNRSYNLGLTSFGRNASTDASDKMRSFKSDLINNDSSTSMSSKPPVHDPSINIGDALAALSLNQNLCSVNKLQQTGGVSSSSNNSTSNVNLSNNLNKTSIINAVVTNDVLNNNVSLVNKMNANSSTSNLPLATHGKNLSTQANTASQQLEMWLNGLQQQGLTIKNCKSNLDSKQERHKVLDSSDVITRELMRQKTETEARKKKIEVLKSKLEAAKTEAERHFILQMYSCDMKTDASSLSSLCGDKVSSTVSSSSTTSSSTIPSSAAAPLASSNWSNSNTLPRCGPLKEAFDQSFAKQKMKLPGLKIPTFRKTTEDGDSGKGSIVHICNIKDTKTSARINGVPSSESKGGSTSKQEIISNGVKPVLSDKEKIQIEKMRKSIESLLKMSLPAESLESSLKDGVILCHVVNHVRQRSVTCIHVPSQTAPVLSIPKIRRNVDNFLLACRRIGVDHNAICSASAIIEEFNVVSLAGTVNSLVSNFSRSTVT